MSSLPVMPPKPPATIQGMLGQGYDVWFLKAKARQELDRSMSSFTCFYQDAMNFAISIHHLVDWYWHLHLKVLPLWQGKEEKDFRIFIRGQSQHVEAFCEISNSFKHCHRQWANKVTDMVKLIPYYGDDQKNAHPDVWANGIVDHLPNGGKLLFLPAILSGNDHYYYKFWAEAALKWWEDFDPATSRPIP